VRANDQPSSSTQPDKASVQQHIPIKNIKIHGSKNTGKERYKPGDQIYVRKVSGFFSALTSAYELSLFRLFLDCALAAI
jgi:poly(3-hydroxybutyrate) depolymerase